MPPGLHTCAQNLYQLEVITSEMLRRVAHALLAWIFTYLRRSERSGLAIRLPRCYDMLLLLFPLGKDFAVFVLRNVMLGGCSTKARCVRGTVMEEIMERLLGGGGHVL